MKINEYLDAIVSTIKSALPDLKICERHPGAFDARELARISSKSPAVYVSLMGLPKVEEKGTGEIALGLTVGLYVVSGDARQLKRYQSSANLLEALSTLIPFNSWGLQCAPAEGLQGRNLFNADLAKSNVDIWALTFRQTLDVGFDIWLEDGTLPTHVYVGIDPDVGTVNQSDYEQVTP